MSTSGRSVECRESHRMDQLQSTFLHFCGHVNVTKTVSDNAWKLYKQLYNLSESMFKEKPCEWFSCLLYLTLHEEMLSDITSKNSISVTTLLEFPKLHCKEFMVKLRIILEQHRFSLAVEQAICLVQKKYLLSCALFDKYSKIVGDIFITEPCPAEEGRAPNFHQHVMERKRLLWLLFLLAKVRLPFNSEELMIAFYLLLSCVVPVITTTPFFLLKPPYNSICQHFQSKDERNVQVLKLLCTEYHVDFSEIYTPIFSSAEWVTFINSFSEYNLDLASMTKEWHSLIQPLSMNELDFLDQSALFVPTLEADQQVLHSPSSLSDDSPGDFERTPIRRRLNKVQHLKLLLTNFSDSPNAKLREYFSNCANDPEESVRLRLVGMRDRYVSAYLDYKPTRVNAVLDRSSSQEGVIPLQRFKLISRLYFRVLESLLTQEEARLSMSDFGSLLHNDTFHKTLIACSALVVNHTYDSQPESDMEPPMDLARLLGAFNIAPYHMVKVIECFIRAEPDLSKESLKHLTLCENQVLERLAWERISPLHEALENERSNRNPSSSSSLSQDVLSHLGGVSYFLSPLRPQRLVNSSSSSSGEDNPSLQQSKSLSNFLNKVCRLAYHRLQHICAILLPSKDRVSNDVIHKIWTCFEHCIKQRNDLLRDRHLDQIMMCCVFAISKVVDSEITFKKIVDAYKTLPHSPTQEIFKRVHMTDDTAPVSIIDFYNQIFMQSTKTYLLQFSPSKRPPPLSPAPRASHSPAGQSPRIMRQNIFVSPMKEEVSSRQLMTPRTRQLYCFGEQDSGSKFKLINEAIRQSATTPKSVNKRLQFDALPGSNGGEEGAIKPSPAKQLKFD